MKVTVLAENTVAVSFMLLAEHGLSLFIEDFNEDSNERVLFDTGQGLGIVNNAGLLGVDLGSTNKIVLSHGHIDHTRGVKPVFDAIGGREIICHPAVYDNKYFKGMRFGMEREIFIGFPYPQKELEQLGARFIFNAGPQKITENITATGEIPFKNDFEKIDKDLYIKIDAEFRPDPLPDDQALIVKTDRGISLITGCAHRGLSNTMEYAAALSGVREFYAVLGGTHLQVADMDRIERTIDSIKKFNVQKIGPCHCTGPKALSILANEFGDKFLFISVGSSVEI